jgi:hypothetical protein
LRIEELKQEIKRIAAIKDPQKALNDLRGLSEFLHRGRLKKIKKESRSRVYFYEMEDVYDTEKKRTMAQVKEPLGSITKEQYYKHKTQIDSLLQNRDKQELSSLINKLSGVGD